MRQYVLWEDDVVWVFIEQIGNPNHSPFSFLLIFFPCPLQPFLSGTDKTFFPPSQF